MSLDSESVARADPAPIEPRITLRARALAALGRCAGPEVSRAEARFLGTQIEEAGSASIDPAALAAYAAAPAPIDEPLCRLAAQLGLEGIELLAVATCAAVEEDPMVGRAIAHLQAPLGGSRPTLGLLALAFGEAGPPGVLPIHTLLAGAAMRSGLLALATEAGPLPERPVLVPLPLCLALHGQDGTWPGAVIGLAELPAVPLPRSILDEAERQARGLASVARSALLLRTGSTTEGRSVACACAAALGLRAVFLETDKLVGLGPWILLRGLLPVYCFDLGPGEKKQLAPVPLYEGPRLALTGVEGGVEQDGGVLPIWSLPVPPAAERQLLWREALGDDQLAEAMAHDHRHPSGRIAQLGRLAHHHAALDGAKAPARAHVVRAVWSGEGTGLETLAQALTDPITDATMIMPPALREEMEILELRSRARDRLVRDLGASAVARYRPGVRALLVGPSGTGKTLAAGWLATQLGIPLYRVDLAAVTSKYIGETEKNLAQLLSRAEQSEVVLLFDEADSIFGKRTEVKDSTDRFANAQTNYLLQRIESFDGIAVLTSNSRGRFDEAFTRRLDMIIDFPLPGPEERRALWLAHLGARHRLSLVQVNQLAATADLGGGHIRNVVLAAAVLAHEHDRAIELADVVRSLASEYRKLGRQMPAELRLGR